MPERVKICGGPCRQRLPLTMFHQHRRNADGLQSACIVCKREMLREWREANPDRARDLDRQTLARIKDDPERWAERQARRRQHQREYRGTDPTRYRAPRSATPVEEINPMVPVGPFADWLRTLGNGEEIARRVSMSPRRIWSLLNGEQATVALDTVDRAVLAVGDGTTLEDIYPLTEAA